MNTIGKLIGDLEEQLINLWRNRASSQVSTKVTFTDFHDLVIHLWKEKILTDSRLSMDALSVFYYFKKYRYMAEDDPMYPQAEYLAKKQIGELIEELKKL